MDSEAHNHDDQESLSLDQGQSSEVDAPLAEDDDNNYQLMMLPENERDYGCRYCQKKFSNKQALGGHQNAHKVERAMEKNTGFFAAAHLPYPNRIAAAPFHRQPEFLHRRFYNWNFDGGVVPYNHRSFNGCDHRPWSPAARMPALPVRPHYNLPVDVRLANFGPGSSGAFRSGTEPGFPDYPPGFGIRPAARVNLRNVPKMAGDESTGIDLSLRLGYE